MDILLINIQFNLKSLHLITNVGKVAYTLTAIAMKDNYHDNIPDASLSVLSGQFFWRPFLSIDDDTFCSYMLTSSYIAIIKLRFFK